MHILHTIILTQQNGKPCMLLMTNDYVFFSNSLSSMQTFKRDSVMKKSVYLKNTNFAFFRTHWHEAACDMFRTIVSEH